MKKFLALFILPAILTCSTGKLKSNQLSALKEGLIKNDSTSIYYLEKGSGDTTLLFLHGWCINSHYWDYQIQEFGSKYKVIAMDLPGFGKSTSTRKIWSASNFGTDVNYLINELKLKNVIIVGHSMSGDVMLEAALLSNPSIVGLIGIDNFGMVDVQYSQEQKEQMNLFFNMLCNKYSSIAPVYAEKMLFIKGSDSSCVARVKNDFINSDSLVAISTMKELVKFDSARIYGLEHLGYRLFIMNSVDLYPTNKEGLAKHCKNSFEIIEIKGTGHYPMIEKPDDFNAKLKEIIGMISKS